MELGSLPTLSIDLIRAQPCHRRSWEEEHYGVLVDRQRTNAYGGYAGRNAAAVGPAGQPSHEGHEVRLRHRRSAAPAPCSWTARLSGRARRRLSTVGAKKVTTIEGLSADGSHPLQKAWQELDVPQCGYCQAGQLLTAAALLDEDREADRRADRHRDERQRLPLRHLPAESRKPFTSRPTAGGGRNHEELPRRHSSIVVLSFR